MKLETMQLKQNHIKQLRERKAWSQSHLAEISDLSLRTIQRIEKEHKASKESVKALASVFETTPEEFLISQKSLKGNRVLWTTGALASVIAFCFVYWWSATTNLPSESLTLDISASLKQLELSVDKSDFQMVKKKSDDLEPLYSVTVNISLKEREKTLVKLNERIDYEITPFFVENEKILLAIRVLDKKQSETPLIASPRIITDNHKAAYVMVNEEDTGIIHQIGITPHR